MIRITIMLTVLAFSGGAIADDGKALYQHCSACHLPDGAGIPGVFPPLHGRMDALAAGNDGRNYIVTVIIAGLIGPIDVAGTRYNGVMPAQPMSDAEIAGVLNYLGSTMATGQTNDWQDFSAEEVAGIRDSFPNANGQDSLKLRKKVPGLQGN